MQDSLMLIGSYSAAWLVVVMLLSTLGVSTPSAETLLGSVVGFLAVMLGFGFYRSYKTPLNKLNRVDNGGVVPPANAGERGGAARHDEPWLAFSVVFVLAGTLVVGCLRNLIAGYFRDQWLVVIIVMLALLSPVLTVVLSGRASSRTKGLCFKTGAWVGLISAFPYVGFGVFFLNALIHESGGWHPNLAEAVAVPLTWIGSVLLPICAWRLWKYSFDSGEKTQDAALPSAQTNPGEVVKPNAWEAFFSAPVSRYSLLCLPLIRSVRHSSIIS